MFRVGEALASPIVIHGDISFARLVIPGLTRNPVFFWIPAFAGMTSFSMIYEAVYNCQFFIDHC